MKMCEEMKKLRTELDKRGIKWGDKSSIIPADVIQEMLQRGIDRRYADVAIFRTHFTVKDYFYSVISGYGTYGGIDLVSGKNGELLECMTEKLNGGEPKGYMTAVDVLRIFDEDLDKKYIKAEDEVFNIAESAKNRIQLICRVRGIEYSELIRMFKNKINEVLK